MLRGNQTGHHVGLDLDLTNLLMEVSSVRTKSEGGADAHEHESRDRLQVGRRGGLGASVAAQSVLVQGGPPGRPPEPPGLGNGQQRLAGQHARAKGPSSAGQLSALRTRPRGLLREASLVVRESEGTS
jgi:hypothetical protein